MRPRRDQGPTTRGLALRPLPFRSQSFGERRRVRLREFPSPFARSTVLKFFAVLISHPILRYEYYQIYCVLAALFSHFVTFRHVFCLANTLLRISVSLCVSSVTHARRRVRYVSCLIYWNVARHHRCRVPRLTLCNAGGRNHPFSLL